MGNFSRFHPAPENLVKVIAFDPGETTGWCVLGANAINLTDPLTRPLHDALHSCGHIEYGQISSQQGRRAWENTVGKHAGLMFGAENAMVSQMLDIVESFGDAAIVFEDFILDFTKADQARHTLSPVRITSAFCYGMHERGLDLSRIHIQNRSLAKTTFTDLRLKHIAMYDQHSGPHARDAIRHAFYFLRDCRGIDVKAREKRHFAWPDRFADPVSIGGESKKEKVKRAPRVGERVQSLG